MELGWAEAGWVGVECGGWIGWVRGWVVGSIIFL